MSIKPHYITQYIAALSVSIGSIGFGAILGYSSPAGAILTSNRNDSSLHLTYSQNSWFSSVVNLGALFGSPVAGFCIDYFGRRGTIIYSVVPGLAGWLLIAAAQNFAMLIAGRILNGFYCTLLVASSPTYIGEIASAKIRGRLVACFGLMIDFGILLAYLMGTVFDSFRWIAGMCAIFPCLCSFLTIFSKESPFYLVSKDKEEEAKRSLIYFRGKDYDGIPTELNRIRESWMGLSQNKANFSDLRKPYVMKPLLISLGLMFFQEFCGMIAVGFNLSIIFKDASSILSPSVSSAIAGCTQLFGSTTCVSLTDKAGRKMLLSISSAVMAMSLVTLGIYFYYKENEPLFAQSINWLPLASLVVYVFSFCIGYGTIPYVVMSELFSPKFKEPCVGLVTLSKWLWCFVVTISFEPLQRSLNYSGVCWLFSGFSLASLIFVLFTVYETKGKTLQEINDYFGAPRMDIEKQII